MHLAKLTHEQKKKRRQQMAESVRGGRAVAAVAADFGVSPALVNAACREHGLCRNRGRRAHPLPTRETIHTFVTPVIRTLATPCWEWNGSRLSTGYGRIGLRPMHRYCYELFNGPLPDGLHCLHDCDNKCCVNPDHLHAGTQADNIREARERGLIRSQPRKACVTNKVAVTSVIAVKRVRVAKKYPVSHFFAKAKRVREARQSARQSA
jgi:hypothetical protein